jgi:ATPase subunit of ABC transporter with duplicated ATPase domains
VTHDRALIDAVATRTWALEARPGSAPGEPLHSVREVLGGYSELLRVRDREKREPVSPERPQPPGSGASSVYGASAGGTAAAASRVARAAARGRSSAAAREVLRLEEQIAEAEAELGRLRALLLEPETFADPERAAGVGREHDRVQGALADLYERWAEVAAPAT